MEGNTGVNLYLKLFFPIHCLFSMFRKWDLFNSKGLGANLGLEIIMQDW